MLRRVSLSLAKGDALAILGESGAGKTLLARAIVGALPEGVDVVGGDIATESGETGQQAFTMVPQIASSSLPPMLSVGEFMNKVAAWNGMRAPLDRASFCRSLLERLALSPREVWGMRPHQLSGGMAQRVAIAAALATRSSGLILDEPTASLDPLLCAELARLLNQLRQDTGLTLLVATHNMGFARATCNRYLLIKNGEKVIASEFGVKLPEQDDYVAQWLCT